MGEKTGRPRGRPPGTKNRTTREREARTAAMAAELEPLIPNAFKGDAHAFLMAVYKDPARPWDMRLEAAQTAIQYEKPKLQAIEASVSVSNHEQALAELE